MNLKAKLLLGLTMSLALSFGFMHTVWPEAPVSFKRLHVFLFNLLTGGSLIIYHTERLGFFSRRVKAYFAVALIYSISAAARLYPITLVASIPLFALVESTRLKYFSFFPMDFFRRDVPVSKKFNHASLLCLSIGIVIASVVMLNNEYLKIFENEKLTLDVFFLGYSFPISLITMSVMFSFMNKETRAFWLFLRELSFWVINVGVIVFFAFIVVKWFEVEIAIASALFAAVCLVLFLFVKFARKAQQKTFLISGMIFLMSTALTGIFYILRYFLPALDQHHALFLTLHAMVSLYGWNLSGLFIIIRWEDFPIRLNSMVPIALHWIIVLVLAPLGMYSTEVSAIAVPAYVALLGIVFFSRGNQEATEP